MASHDGIKPQQGTRKLSFQPHKLTAAQRRHIEATYTAQIDQLSSQLATLQADSIRLKNRGMLLECQLAIKDDQLAEASGHVQVHIAVTLCNTPSSYTWYNNDTHTYTHRCLIGVHHLHV